MLKTTLLFGVCLALLLALMKWVEYAFFTKDLALEAYLGVVGLVCTILGGWMGWKLTQRRVVANGDAEFKAASGMYDPNNSFNLSPREHEVLVLISQGHSYQEIADRLNVSISTIKTHAANLFSKMDVQRRTQAVMLAQKRGILPRVKG
jgi:DNA-binding CsgD family transcriptional regulator